MLLGISVGIPVGGLTWVLVGCCLGAAVIIGVRLILPSHPFRGNFFSDLFQVSMTLGMLLGLPGLLVGAVVGGAAGRAGRPPVAGAFEGSRNALLKMGSNPIIALPAVFASGFMIVTYLADPRNFNWSNTLVVGGIGIFGGLLVLLALWFRAAMSGGAMSEPGHCEVSDHGDNIP